MRTKAFTLIEVMVVMAIISILAGMLVPSVWKFWESEEIAITRERMHNLKIAMVGDKTLVQNGVRTHFGFVGDVGQLPFGNISGIKAYMPSGFDPNTYNKDAWGTPFSYELGTPVGGRYFDVKIVSNAPNGGRLEEIISESEVTPSRRVKGNFHRDTLNSYSSIQLDIRHEKYTFSGLPRCILLKGNSFFENYSAILDEKIPIGRVEISLRSSHNMNCSTLSQPNNYIFYVPHDIDVIRVPDLR